MSSRLPRLTTRARSESGSIIILTALSMVVMLGIVALAVDGSFMYTERNRMAAAADAGAKSAVLEYIRNRSASNATLLTFANREAVAHGFNPAGPASVVLNRPPAATSAYSGNANYIQVIVSQPTGTFFSRILSGAWSSVTPVAAATAGFSAPENCFITMQDLELGNDTIDLNGCGVSVGGNLNPTNPNSTIDGPVSISGTCVGGCPSGIPDYKTSQPPPTNPFAGIVPPTCSSPTTPAPGTTFLSDGCYTSIPNTVTTFSGIVSVTGIVNIGATLSGTGMLHLTGTATIDVNNNATLSITATNNLPYAGIALLGEPGSSMDVKNAFTFDVNGAVVMPGSNVDFKNHLHINDTGCTLMIFNNFDENNGNGATLSSANCATSFSNASYLDASLAE